MGRRKVSTESPVVHYNAPEPGFDSSGKIPDTYPPVWEIPDIFPNLLSGREGVQGSGKHCDQEPE